MHVAHRVADGHGQLADLQLIAVAEGGGVQTLRVDLEHRDVVALGGADQRGLVGRFLGALFLRHDVDGDLVRAGDDVVVGQDVAVLGEDDAGAGAGLLVFTLVAAAVALTVAIAVAIAREQAAERIVVAGLVVVVDDGGFRLDGDDGGAALLGDLGYGEGIGIGRRFHDGEVLILAFCHSEGGCRGRNGKRQRRRQREKSAERTGSTHNDQISFQGCVVGFFRWSLL